MTARCDRLAPEHRNLGDVALYLHGCDGGTAFGPYDRDVHLYLSRTSLLALRGACDSGLAQLDAEAGA